MKHHPADGQTHLGDKTKREGEAVYQAPMAFTSDILEAKHPPSQKSYIAIWHRDSNKRKPHPNPTTPLRNLLNLLVHHPNKMNRWQKK
jgi:hypothetical protein